MGAFEPRRRAIARLEVRLRRARAETEAANNSGDVGRTATDSPLDWAGSAEHCRAAYLRGLFLAHGSLSLAAGRTHLEFVVGADEAESLARRLGELGLPASWRLRRGRGVVTWKSSETVGTFLRMVGGGAALLELEARQVSRSVRGDLNRVINAESANLQRGVAAAARQLEAIDAVEADGQAGPAVEPGPSRGRHPTRDPRGHLHGAGGAAADPPFGRSAGPGPHRIPGAPCRRGSGEARIRGRLSRPARARRGTPTLPRGPSVQGRGAECPSGTSSRSVIIAA